MLAPGQPLFTLRALVGQSPLVALCTPGDTIGKRHRYLLQYSPEQQASLHISADTGEDEGKTGSKASSFQTAAAYPTV